MAQETAARIRIGIGGWTFEPWRGPFYPDGLTQKRELEFASRKLTSIEINGTYYGSHALELRHDSFRTAEVVELAREHGVAIVVAGDSAYPQIADVTAPFVYARIMGTSEDHAAGYAEDALDAWAGRARAWAAGNVPGDLDLVAQAADHRPRDVFLYVISGAKVRNPAAAMALIERVDR